MFANRAGFAGATQRACSRAARRWRAASLLDGARGFAVGTTRNFPDVAAWTSRKRPIVGRRSVARCLAVLAAFPFLRRFLGFIEFALPFLVFALAFMRRGSLPCHLDSVTSASSASGRIGVAGEPAFKPPMPAQVRRATPRGVSRPPCRLMRSVPIVPVWRWLEPLTQPIGHLNGESPVRRCCTA